MSEWTKQRLEQMIADGIEESLSLDYKGAGAFGKTDAKKFEITKDVSSFANSTGGLLVYGIIEFGDEPRRHLPERIDPIQRTEFSKEWLDNVIQTIQPRIEGLIIHPVTISEADNTVCYIVEIPQSYTAHMARDHRYHKRQNFTTAIMEDYELRDVMNRRKHPKIQASIFVNKRAGGFSPEGYILVKIENVGCVLARHVMVELEIPFDMNGLITVEGQSTVERTNDGDFHLLRLISEHPIFPGSYVVLERKIHTDAVIKRKDGEPIRSSKRVKIKVFADEATPLSATLDIAPVLLGWTVISD